VLTTAATARSTQRWIAYIGLWLLLSCVFASQLYLAGYVTPWPRAFAAEAVYWFSWALLAPAVFWMCRRLYRLPWTRYAPVLLMGAIVAAILQPLIPQLLQTLQSWLHLCIGPCETLPPWFSGAWLTQTVRVAGVRIGDIGAVELKDGRAIVRMDIDRKYEDMVHTDATALLRPKTGLKDMFIQLDPGTDGAPVAKENWTIPVDSTSPDVNPDEILSTLDSDTRDYLRLLISDLGRGLKGRNGDLRDLFRRFEPTHRDLAAVNGAIAERRTNLRRLITSLNQLNGELASHDDDIAGLVTASSAVLRSFARGRIGVPAAGMAALARHRNAVRDQEEARQ